ncbi:MAG: hypothetical protein A4E54_01222 [Pelotomaculum sp. PtaB.Bin117]|nr:MAG: hypothetical protein A4E54_01222 [Pelotomaculum sp. PtaB.Bin117]OPY60567.1 MAG: hypothetical protein A4E56_02607 [Pelotomaculum sp. PtaU1.Bin065]
MLFPYSCQGGIMVLPWTNQGGNTESVGFSSLMGERFYFYTRAIAFPYLIREGYYGQLGWYRGNLLLFVPYYGSGRFYTFI